MTKLDFAKLAVNLTVAAVSRKVVRENLEQHTGAPDIIVEVTSGVAGAVIADKLKPTTDEMVEQVAAKLKKLRNKKN